MVFQCMIEGCGKNFSCKKTLKEHQRTHTGERPYVCVHCQTTFAQYSSLQKHQRVHDKKKPYKCTYAGCEQAFSQISNLIRHQRIHTGEKPYVCNICHKSFASGSNLKQHVQVHDNDETRIQFKCYVPTCDRGYLYLSSLKKHIQVSHPIEYETQVQTNQVDLNNCKEVIKDLENHHYHDDEEDQRTEHQVGVPTLLGKRKTHETDDSQSSVIVSQQQNKFKNSQDVQDQKKTMLKTESVTIQRMESLPSTLEMPTKRVKKEAVETNLNSASVLSQDSQNKSNFEHFAKKNKRKENYLSMGESQFDTTQNPPPMGSEGETKPSGNMIAQYSFPTTSQFDMAQQYGYGSRPQSLMYSQPPQYNQYLSGTNLAQPDYVSSFLAQPNQQNSLYGAKSNYQGNQQYDYEPVRHELPPIKTIQALQQVQVQPQIVDQVQQAQPQYESHIFNPFNLKDPQPKKSSPTDLQSQLVDQMKMLQQQLQQEAPEKFAKVQSILNNFALAASALTMHLTKSNPEAGQQSPRQERIQRENKVLQVSQILKQLTDSQDVASVDQVDIKNKPLNSESVTQEINFNDNSVLSQTNITMNKNEMLKKPSVVPSKESTSNITSLIKFESQLTSQVNPTQNKRFKFQSKPLIQSNPPSQKQTVQASDIVMVDKDPIESLNFKTSRSNSFSSQNPFGNNIKDIYEQADKDLENPPTIEYLPQVQSMYEREQPKQLLSKDSSQGGCGGGSSKNEGCCGGGCGSGQSQPSGRVQMSRDNIKKLQQEVEDSMLMELNDQELNHGFKQPLPMAPSSHPLIKNKDQALQIFSKLPCIKTCMTKISFSGDPSTACSSQQPKPNQGFQKVEDDFEMQSNAQLGTAACKHICDAQKLCPEILPLNCDDYFQKKCNCTVYQIREGRAASSRDRGPLQHPRLNYTDESENSQQQQLL